MTFFNLDDELNDDALDHARVEYQRGLADGQKKERARIKELLLKAKSSAASRSYLQLEALMDEVEKL